jgi:hypothetical protein
MMRDGECGVEGMGEALEGMCGFEGGGDVRARR